MGNLEIYLIRHGESVDNVSGLYAGSRDSPLTAHGVLQANRLALHLAGLVSPTQTTHIFTSNLQRAVRTAAIIREAIVPASSIPGRVEDLKVPQLVELRERDFGSDEGKKFAQATSRAADAETHAAVHERAVRFLESRLAPLISAAATGLESRTQTLSQSKVDAEVVFVVAHGLILASLLRALRNPALFAHIPPQDASSAWSNTGYTKLVVSRAQANGTALSSADAQDGRKKVPRWPALRLEMECANHVSHLSGLKKTRGGIGSARFDEKQTTLTSFFAKSTSTAAKKRKAEEQLEK